MRLWTWAISEDTDRTVGLLFVGASVETPGTGRRANGWSAHGFAAMLNATGLMPIATKYVGRIQGLQDHRCDSISRRLYKLNVSRDT